MEEGPEEELSRLFVERMNFKKNDFSAKELATLVRVAVEEGSWVVLFKLLLKSVATNSDIKLLKAQVKKNIALALERSVGVLQRKVSDMEEKCMGLEHRIESSRKKMTADNEMTLKKLAEISALLSARPWAEGIAEVSEELASRPSFEDLYSIKLHIEPNIEELRLHAQASQKAIKDFEGIIARIDEILLTKSSKDDISYISSQFSSYVTKDSLQALIPTLESRLSSLESFLSATQLSIQNIQNEGCVKLSHRNTSKDFSVLFNKLAFISTRIEAKVDKVEILPVLESSEIKDLTFKRSLEGILNDFQQMAILQQETLKTMIRSLDSAEKKNKLRIDLLRNAEKIVGSVTLKISESKNSLPIKSASFGRHSVSPEPQDRVVNSSLSRSSYKRNKRQVFTNKSNRGSLDM